MVVAVVAAVAAALAAATRGPAPSGFTYARSWTLAERVAHIDWPADEHAPARGLRIEATPPLDYFVLYCPRGQPFFCAEPVSQCTDWLNLLPHHEAQDLGGTQIAPRESMGASFSLRPVA